MLRLTTQTKIVVVSRLANSDLLRTCEVKYRISGLTLPFSMTLLENLAFGNAEAVPEAFYQRDNLDHLHRVITLFEGIPAAVKCLVPALKDMRYDAKTLFSELMYGFDVGQNNGLKRELMKSRIGRTISLLHQRTWTSNTSLWDPIMSIFGWKRSAPPSFQITATDLAPFWTLMPLNLTMYYGALHLPNENDMKMSEWCSDETGQKVLALPVIKEFQRLWPEVARDLRLAGILDDARIVRRNGSASDAYHIHPLFTLLARAFKPLDERSTARRAYVWQIISWQQNIGENRANERDRLGWFQEVQDEDHLYNWRFVALRWARELGEADSAREFRRAGASEFESAFELVHWMSRKFPQHAKFLVTDLRQRLKLLQKIVNQQRSMEVPGAWEVSSIGMLTHALSVIEVEHGCTGSLSMEEIVKIQFADIDTAIELYLRWKKGTREDTEGTDLLILKLFLAKARNFAAVGKWEEAQEVLERYLQTDASTLLGGHAPPLRFVKYWKLECLLEWNKYVAMDPRFGNPEADRECVARHWLKPMAEKITTELQRLFSTDPNTDISSLTVQELVKFALRSKPDAALGFDRVTKEVLDASFMEVMFEFIGGDITQFFGNFLTNFTSNLMSMLSGSGMSGRQPMGGELGNVSGGSGAIFRDFANYFSQNPNFPS
ncbi:uncharacterized protein CTHT_0049780 [Thermochaetoides thermophila DSM 1495]|uniref:Uncharacterized protein n=1 Tax=Chaetomium thermophilum (strain DSM 1495 / CBS 144.50 / IMI 039719) TaxID=759272 RepID=G0SBC8_CHATD|nr:hypothetical protein CTHT_0049780 [Thermochaetoides thermophila DSM 1495]EGS19508.1 hypothetical protein CTHT_0049780 [Thermochaetoides thermophila DSM 1495]